MAEIKAPIPKQNESVEQYTVRAHQQLIRLVPDPDKRNTMVWSAWQHHRGLTPAEQRAKEEFGDSARFIPQKNVCYFVEHETLDNQGEPIRFGLTDLVEIERNCNKRASDRKAFSAISDNHTSPNDQSHKGDPPVLGAVGNYKLGMVGHEEPKWAIFADEYHKSESAELLRNKPRRSVELITFHNTGERFIDPVAALGGRAPRLPLPAQYSVANYSSDGSEITRYQMEGPGMMPGPGNTHIKSTDYFTGDQSTDNEESSMAISDEDISKIINALGNMPEFSWVREQMEAQNGGAVDPASKGGMDDVGGSDFDDMSGPDDDIDPTSMEGPDDADDFGDEDPDKTIDRNSAFRGEASGSAVVTPPNADASYDDQQRFSANYYPAGNAMNNFVTVERYNAMVESQKSLIRELGSFATKMKALEQEKVDANRRNEINLICNEFPGFYSQDEECSRLLYSAGANVSDDQFKGEIDRMKSLANRASIQQNTIPRGEVYRPNSTSSASVDRNSAWYDKSVEIQTEAGNRGEFIEWSKLEQMTDAAMKK